MFEADRTDDGLAQVFYQALLTVFHSWTLAFDQALALIERSGDDIDRFLSYAQRSSEAYPFFMAEYAAAKNGGWGDLASFAMIDAGAQHIVDASAEAGVAATLSRTAQTFWGVFVRPASRPGGRSRSSSCWVRAVADPRPARVNRIGRCPEGRFTRSGRRWAARTGGPSR